LSNSHGRASRLWFHYLRTGEWLHNLITGPKDPYVQSPLNAYITKRLGVLCRLAKVSLEAHAAHYERLIAAAIATSE